MQKENEFFFSFSSESKFSRSEKIVQIERKTNLFEFFRAATFSDPLTHMNGYVTLFHMSISSFSFDGTGLLSHLNYIYGTDVLTVVNRANVNVSSDLNS